MRGIKRMEGRGRAAMEQADYERRAEIEYEPETRLKQVGRQMTMVDRGQQRGG
jgi:hypothetical protein